MMAGVRCPEGRRRLGAAASAVVLFLGIASAHAGSEPEDALAVSTQPELRVVSFQPSTSTAALGTQRKSEPVLISGKQALTATFSHAVIALGEDFGPGALPEYLNPFQISPPVAGRVRWVTTSIARFDIDGEWPAELRFNVTFKHSLRAVGSGLRLGDPAPTFALKTRPLSMSAVAVRSSQALAVTNGTWDAALAPVVSGALEVPPDGRVQLSFSSAVDMDMLRSSLQLIPAKLDHVPAEVDGPHKGPSRPLLPGAKPDGALTSPSEVAMPITLSPCPHPTARCVQVEAERALDTGMVYLLVLPAGSRFHPASGPTLQRLSVKLSGLVPFEFPFLQVERESKSPGLRGPRANRAEIHPRYRRHVLLLRHGLAPDTSLAQLHDALSLTPSLPFTLTRPTAATLMLEASFEPNTEYTLTVQNSSDVRDGFGLPLQAGHSTFLTAKAATGFLLPSRSNRLGPARFHTGASLSAPTEWYAAAFGGIKCASHGDHCDEQTAARALLTSVTPGNLKSTLAMLRNPRIPSVEPEWFGSLSAYPATDFEVRSASLNGHLQSESQLVLVFEQQNKDWPSSSLLSAGRVEVVVLGVPDGSVLLWALDSSTNTPAAGAQVEIYRIDNPYSPRGSDAVRADQGVTDSQGLLHLPHLSGSGNYFALLRPTSSPELLVQEINVNRPRYTPRPLAVLLTDRGVYKEGDKVFLKGYVRMPNGASLELLPHSASLKVRVYWQAGKPPTETPVSVDREHGAFNATLTVPDGARYEEISISLRVSGMAGVSRDSTMTIASANIAIADPRPPTVALTFAAGESVGAGGVPLIGTSRVLPPNGTVGLNVHTSTLSGVPVGNASVTLRWRLERAARAAPCVFCAYPIFDAAFRFIPPGAGPRDPGDAEEEGLSGEEQLTTDAKGVLSKQWRPTSIAAVERLGDSLHVEIEWVGPTREILSQSIVVPVALSELSLSLSVPRHSELPKHTFELSADLTTHAALGGSRVLGVPLEFLLYQLQDDLDAGSHGDVWFTNEDPAALPDEATLVLSAHCIVPASSIETAHSAACEMQLPSVGQFVGAVCALDRDDGKTRQTCSAVRLGRSNAAWLEQPLREYLQLAVTPEVRRTSYAVGETGQIALHNPLQTPLAALLAWGNTLDRKVLTKTDILPGKSTIEFKVGTECLGGCELSLHLAAASDADRAVEMPVSPLFEIRAPMLASHSFELEAQPSQRTLRVGVTPDQPVARPGGNAGVTLTLHDTNGHPVAGEVCLFAVDKAMLALRPHPLVNLADALVPNLRGSQYLRRASYEQLVSLAGLKHSAERLQRLIELDPWLSVSWPLQPSSARGGVGDASVETPIDLILSRTWTAITAMPSRWVPAPFGFGVAFDEMEEGFPEMAMPMMDVAADADGAGGAVHFAAAPLSAGEAPDDIMLKRSESTAARSAPAPQAAAVNHAEVHIRSEFLTTPLFLPTVRVDTSGSAHVPWQLPENSGAFELRAYAITTGDAQFGSATADQLVRKTVTLGASVPRIARVGDVLECGVTVTGSPELAPDTQLEVSLELVAPAGSPVPPLQLSGEATRAISLSPDQTIEVTFPLQADAVAEATLHARVSSATDASLTDALEMKLPVLGLQPEVSVATSRALTATADTALWTEGVVLPAAVPGSGLMTVETGIGRYPVVSAIASGLLAHAKSDYYDHAMTHIGVIAAIAMVTPYAKGGELLERLERELPTAVAKLERLTSSDRGLRYSSWDRGNHVDIYLNAYALIVLRRAVMLGLQLSSALGALRVKWTHALETGLERAVRDARRYGSEWKDSYTLAHCRLALGYRWKSTDPSLVAALAMQVVLDDIDALGVFGMAAVALTLLMPDAPTSDSPGFHSKALRNEVLGVVRLFESQMRVTARTAYVTSSPSSASSAGLSANAIALSVFATAMRSGLTDADSTNVDKIANWVSLGGNVGTDSVYAGLALADYDVAVGNVDADVHLALSVGGTPLLEQELLTLVPTPPPFSIAWHELPQPIDPLLFMTKGHGEASVALSLSFVPAELMPEPVERGVSVRKVIRRFDAQLGEPVGKPLAAVPLGQLVTVTVQLTIDDDLRNLLIEDWLPAGLEAIDPLANALNGEVSAGGGNSVYCMWWWRCVYFSRETRKDRVSFYTSYAYAGTHTVSYQAIAATRGIFGLPPTRATATLQPEVMGLSAAGHLTVLDSSALALPQPRADVLKVPSPPSPPSPPPSAIKFAPGNDTLIVTAGSDVEHHLPIHGSEEPPKYTFALSPNASSINHSAMSLFSMSSDVLVFKMRAPLEVQEPTCFPIFLAASLDGAVYESRRLEVWSVPKEHAESFSRRLMETGGADGNFSRGECSSFFHVHVSAEPMLLQPGGEATVAVTVCALLLMTFVGAVFVFLIWRERFSAVFLATKHKQLVESKSTASDVKEADGAEIPLADASSGTSTPEAVPPQS